jgi:hypothetical protein
VKSFKSGGVTQDPPSKNEDGAPGYEWNTDWLARGKDRREILAVLGMTECWVLAGLKTRDHMTGRPFVWGVQQIVAACGGWQGRNRLGTCENYKLDCVCWWW